VRGVRANTGARRLTRADERELPGAFGDAFRALEALPGVTPITSGLPYFFVRGAPPGNTGYFIDGVSIPTLYHAAVGPSVIHPAFIENVEVQNATLGRETTDVSGYAYGCATESIGPVTVPSLGLEASF